MSTGSSVLLFTLAFAQSAPPLKGWHYGISVDPALSTLTSTLCFDGAPPKLLVPAEDYARAYLKGARSIGEKATELRVTKEGIRLPRNLGSRDPPCIRYLVKLAEATKERDWDIAMAVGKDVVFSPDLWLWQPPDLPAAREVIADFDLPPGVQISTPWERLPAKDERARFRISDSTFEWQGAMALGRFALEPVVVKGSTLSVARLDRPTRATKEGVLHWIEEAATAVTLLYGTFPIERVQVLVRPIDRRGAVEFGMIERGGGPTALFILSTKAEDRELVGEWIAVHELSHLALPFVERTDAWLSEGFATYYQDVLRARSGHMSERGTWQDLHEGFERGKQDQTGRSLAETTARMDRDHNYMRVYWSGAAIALLADVELRTRTSGARSLDTSVSALRECCLHEARRFSAKEVFARLDRASGSDVFRRLYERYAPSKTFPDLGRVYRALGLVVEGERIRLDDQAPLAAIRRAIMARRR